MEPNKERYRKYSRYLKEKYGEKVYKIPINLPVTCPNRDGNLGTGGCIFCGEIGTGFESLESIISVREQLNKNIKYIGEKYNANKFIAYFQNFTNTYMPIKMFKEYMEAAANRKDIVEISISTRPDCINEEYLKVLEELRNNYKKDISIELGLQSTNHNTLRKINRGHSLAEFIDAMIRINRYGFESCCHLILNLPWDSKEDIIEAAKTMSALDVKQVKLHSLYILRNTKLGKMYEENKIELITVDEYVERVTEFLRYLNPQIVIQRLLGRAPKEETLFCNWDMSWWRIQDMIDDKLKELDIYQGQYFDYLNGKAVKGFLK